MPYQIGDLVQVKMKTGEIYRAVYVGPARFLTGEKVVLEKPYRGPGIISSWTIDYQDVPIKVQESCHRYQISLPNKLGWLICPLQSEIIGLASQQPSSSAGMACTSCKEVNEYAVSNQPDGTFKCYRCRN